MIADRLLDWLGRVVGYVPTRWSVARIAGFTVAGLFLASVVVPARPPNTDDAMYHGLATRSARNVALPFGDTRGFKASPRPKSFRIAWVGGSELLGKGKKLRALIPAEVTSRIGKVDGKRVSTDVYYLNAIRLVDQLSALTNAVASKPDMVVISLNPVWVMNDLAVQQWGYLDGLLALNSRTTPSMWPVVASLVSPGDVGWQLVSEVSGAVNDRFDWGIELKERTEGLSFLHDVEGATAPPLTELGRLAQRRPVDFFFKQNKAETGGDLTNSQLNGLLREVSSESSFNRAVLRQMFAVVKKAGVDAYFYMPPISSEVYEDPQAQKYIAEVRALLAEATEGLSTDHAVFDPQGLQDRVPPTEYEDLIHVLDPRPEARVLSGDLCTLLSEWGRDPECEQP